MKRSPPFSLGCNMRKINFTKMVASGNDFVVIDGSRYVAKSESYKLLARNLCDRKFGIGADGLLVLGKSKAADVRMRIFNADGSEAEMCGNGVRCTALYMSHTSHPGSQLKIETKAGIIESLIKKDTVKIKLTAPKGLKQDLPVDVNGRKLRVNFINTGVPHAVIFVDGLDKIDVFNLGRCIRYHKVFSPAGANVNFIEALGRNAIKIRTYERGVEDETLACGTGSTASALIFALKAGLEDKVMVHTRGKEILTVYFTKKGLFFSDVWLEGRARIVYKGAYNV
jgi:diaminopimelate epimerase